MEANLGDIVLKEINDRVDKALNIMTAQYKNVKPFNKMSVSSGQIQKSFKELSMEDWNYLIDKYGYDTLLGFERELRGEK